MRRAPPLVAGAEADAVFLCVTLGCHLRARACVARQVVNDQGRVGDLGPRSSRRKRGLVDAFPACDTRRCAVGRAIRLHLGDAVAATVRVGSRPPLVMAAWNVWVRLHRSPPPMPRPAGW